MAIIGTICPNVPGHLNPLTTLCRELQRRGHRVILYQVPLAAEKIRSREFEVRCFGEKEYPPAENLKNQQVQATLSGYKALRHTRERLIRGIGLVIRQVPAMLREDHIELMLVDQVSMGGGTASELAGLPFLTICNALMVNRDELAPPFFTSWRYRTDRGAPKLSVTWEGDTLRQKVCYPVACCFLSFCLFGVVSSSGLRERAKM
jgi:UDP:flavonoid glycosyltransferase YjiC (YdhE family)